MNKVFFCETCYSVWQNTDMHDSEGVCLNYGCNDSHCNNEELLEPLEGHEVIARMFVYAGMGLMSIEHDYLDKYLGIKMQKTFQYKERKQTIRGWESFCAFVYYKITGNDHPGSMANGRGFRSQQAYGNIVAKAIRDSYK